jgi:hypothetical protein
MSYLYRVYMDCIHKIMIVSESSQSLPNQEGRPGRDRMHSVSITTDVVGSTPTSLIYHLYIVYVEITSDLRF